MDFYKKVEKLCQDKGISLTRLTIDLGISKSNQTSWKRGSKPQNKTISNIAAYFGVPISYFSDNTCIAGSQFADDYHGTIVPTLTSANGSMRKLSEQAVELLNIYDQLSVIDQAKLIVFAEELKNK